MADLTENRIKHLEMIQAIIARMASESARMKQFGLTVVGILASVSKAADVPMLAVVGAVMTVIFWFLDARYLEQERWYRAHYDVVRETEGNTDFDMTPSMDIRRKHQLADTLIGWSTLPIYGALLGVSLFLALGVEPAATTK